MIAVPSLLAGPAQAAGIEVPPDTDNFDAEQFLRFHVFCNAQLGRRMPNWSCHWENAKVVAAVPEKQLKTITFAQLEELGFQA